MNTQDIDNLDEKLSIPSNMKQDMEKSTVPQQEEKYPEAPKASSGLPQQDNGLNWIMVNQDGKIAYAIAWLLGVPASVLVVIFLIRGH